MYMTDARIVKKLQKFLWDYEHVEEGARWCTFDNRCLRINRKYQEFCDKYNLRQRVWLPFHIWDIYKYTLLLDEIKTGVLLEG